MKGNYHENYTRLFLFKVADNRRIGSQVVRVRATNAVDPDSSLARGPVLHLTLPISLSDLSCQMSYASKKIFKLKKR